MKSKFGDYATLDALAEQWRVQEGTFDPRVLTDRSPSKAKIHRHLMIEKVVDRINKLEQPHLKLVVMHDFMWALVKEQASDRAHKHRIRNQDSRRNIQVVESEAHDISQSIIGHTLWPTVCEYIKDQTLTVNMLWEVAYGVCHKVLHLDSLEDFNATEADLMDLKKDILTTWESRDRCRTSSLGPTFTPFVHGCQRERFHLRWNFHPLQGHCVCKYPSQFWLWPGRNAITPLETLSPTSWDPASLDAPISRARNLAHFELLCNGDTHGVQFWSYDGTTLVTISLKYLFLSLPVTWDVILYPC